MSEPRNFANAAIIVAGIYFLINESFGFWAKVGVFAVIGFAILTWGHYYYPFKDQQKDLIEAQIKSEEARALNFNAGSKQLFIQSKLLERGLEPGT